MICMFQAYRDDSKGVDFKFLIVFSRIEMSEKWKKTRLNLAKNKDGMYKPDVAVAPVSEGRLELSNKKSKVAKAMGPPGE
jgi:hypothetical protein